MSRGLGHIERMLPKLLGSIGAKTYSITELCEEVYVHEWIEKRHRVAMLRALKDIIEDYPTLGLFYGRRGTYIVCDCANLEAYAVMQARCRWNLDHQGALERLKEELKDEMDRHDFQKNMAPESGLWWMRAEWYKAERDGDTARAKELHGRVKAIEDKERFPIDVCPFWAVGY